MAWRLGAKTRVLALGAAVGLCLCPSNGLPAGMDPYCSSGVPRALHSGWLQPADIAIQQPLKHSIKQQAMQFFAESVCRDEAVLDLRIGTMKRLMAHWVLHACAEVQKRRASQRKSGATSLGHSKRHRGLQREPLASTSMAHSSMTRSWNNRSHRRKRITSSMSTTTTTSTMLRIPRARGQLLQKHLSRFRQWLPKSARAERFLCLRCAYG